MAQIHTIEGIRKSQSLLRVTCLGIIFALVGFTAVTVYGSYRALDSRKFTENLKKELHDEFQPDLERLGKEGEAKLLPALKEQLERSLKERLPRIQERYEKLAHSKAEELARRFDQSALVYFREFEAALRREIPEAEMHLVLQKLKETEERILAGLSQDLHDEMEKVRPKMERIQDSLRTLAERPEVRGLRLEEAKDLFLEAAIDLFKYEVVRSRGDALETHGSQKNQGEGGR